MADAVTQMQAMLARVRPVGMSDSAAREWLAVAATDVCHLPHKVLAAACDEAKRTVDLHTRIVSAVLGSQAVKTYERHEREIKRLLMDGHSIPGRTAPALTDQRTGAKRLGSLKVIEDHRG